MKQFFMIAVMLLALVSCQNEPNTEPEALDLGPVIAQVGDKKFHDTDIDSEIMSLPQSMRYVMQGADARAQMLDVMIKREVVAQKAREMGLNYDPLIAYRMRKAENEVLIQAIQDWQHKDFKKVSDDALKDYYQKHQQDFVIPKQIHARHILVADKQAALELRKQLKAKPQSFATLAAQFSMDDSTKGRGGDLNWFSQGDMVAAFDKAAFALNEKNPLSQPIKTKFGWHIVQWLGERKAQTSSLGDASIEIQSILEKQALKAWIESLLNDADVEILKEEYQTF